MNTLNGQCLRLYTAMLVANHMSPFQWKSVYRIGLIKACHLVIPRIHWNYKRPLLDEVSRRVHQSKFISVKTEATKIFDEVFP